MGRLTTSDREVMRTFWRAHMDGWKRSDLNQREYCEVHGLSLKNFGNWRAQLKYEDTTSDRKVRWRRRRTLGPMTNPMTNEVSASIAAAPESSVVVPRSGRRRQFNAHAKRLIVEETERPGATVSAVARRYGIAASVLFRWKHALRSADEKEPVFLPVRLDDGAADGQPATDTPPSPGPHPLIIERPTPAVEIELTGGRRLRFDRDVDPDMVRRMVCALEGGSP